MPGDPLVDLLQRQLTGGLPLSDSIEQLAQADPRFDQIAQVLAQREAQLQQDLERQEHEERQEADEAYRLSARRERAEALRRTIEEMAAELEALRTTLDDVAQALGACPSCLGTDPGCRWCRGRGQPGFMPPDPEGFDRLVMPAVRAHAYLRRRDTPETANQPVQERNAS